jgi:arylsulfatase A-like enzyme
MADEKSGPWRGAVRGAVAWGAFAVVETVVALISPLLIEPAELRTRPHAGFSALVLVLYPLVGLVAGGLAGWLVRQARRMWKRGGPNEETAAIDALAVGSLVAAYLVALALQARNDLAALSAALPFVLGITVVLMVSATSRDRSHRLAFVTGPWPVAIVLGVLPWLAFEGWILSDWMRIATVLAVGSLVIGVSYVVASLRSRPKRPATAVFTLLAALLPVVTLAPAPTPPGADEVFTAGPATAERPHVVLITLDTVRADHLSLYGYERATTPFLERLARESTVYTRAFAPGAMTLSTHASLFTGLYASRHGAHNAPHAPDGAPLDDDVATLAGMLTDAGYATLGVVSNIGYLSPDFGLDRGFTYYDNRMPVRFLELGKRYQLRRAVRNALALFAHSDLAQKWYRTADEINAATLPLLERARESRRPVFLFLNYMDAHDPYLPDEPFDDRFPGRVDDISHRDYVRSGRAVLGGNHTLTEREREHVVSQYDGEIAYLDSRLEQLFDHLKRLGLYDRALIVVTSDHGEAFGEHDLVHHGVSVYQDQVFVPLLLKYPGSHEARSVDAPVSLVDVMPTILHAAGLAAPPAIDGSSLSEPPSPERLLISESYPGGDIVALSPRFDRVVRAVYSGRLKLIVSSNGERSLFDLDADPAERNDLYGALDADARGLERRLGTWMDTVVTEIRKSGETSRLAQDRLRALGYVQ